jgi:hypothetical protein
MQAIYDQDQENERQEKSVWSRGGRPRPAIEWRWMFYGIIPELGIDSPLRARLRSARLVDEGTGSTFEALEARRYILVQYKPVIGGSLTYVQITPVGRKLVRQATDEQREKSLLPGTLREWHWRAITEVWKSRPAGVKMEHDWYGDYGGMSWKTWLRLRDYKAQGEEKSLVEEYHTAGSYNASTGTRYDIHWIRLTTLGEQLYRENWARYHEMYPSVDAPDPTGFQI